MFFSPERVDELCLLARKKLADMATCIVEEVDYRGTSIKKDDLIRYWEILTAVEYRKAYDNADEKFQKLVLLLYSKLRLALETNTNNENYIGIGYTPTENQQALLTLIQYITNVLLPLKANDADVLHKTGDETKVSGVLTFTQAPVGPEVEQDNELINFGQVKSLIQSIDEYELPVADLDSLGGVKGGGNVDIAGDGTLSVEFPPPTPQYVLPTADPTTLGGVKEGTEITVAEDGTLGLNIDKSLQAVTDVGNRTDNDIILDKSKVVFEMSSIARRVDTGTGGTIGVTLDANEDVYIMQYTSGNVKKALKSENYSTFRTILSRTGTGTGLDQWSNSTSVEVDKDFNIYISDYMNFRILKFAPGATSGTIVAGGNGQGSGLNQLHNARAVAFDKNNNLFVIDSANSRVLKYTAGSTTGVVVAGGNGQGTGLNQMWGANDLAFDKNGFLYVMDTFNYRVMRYEVGVSTTGVIVAGGNGNGSALNQISTSRGLAIDEQGRIYVAESNNRKIKRFTVGVANSEVVSDWATNVLPFNGLTYPYEVAVDKKGHYIFVSDEYNNGIIIDYVGPDVVDLEAVGGELYRNDKRLLTELDLPPLATNEFVTTADLVLQEQVDDLKATKVNKNATQTSGRVIFVDTDGELVGQGNFTFDKTSGQLKVNTTGSNNNYKALVGGGLSLLSGAFNMDEYQSVLYMSGGRCALLVDGNGMHYRLFNNDMTDFPDTSKSFVWRNKGFVHFRCYTTPLALNGQGQPTSWRQINSFEKFVRFPDVVSTTGSYKVAVINNSTKELELVEKDLLSSRRNVRDMVLIDNGDLSGLADYDEYRTSAGDIKYKLPEELSGKFSPVFSSVFA